MVASATIGIHCAADGTGTGLMRLYGIDGDAASIAQVPPEARTGMRVSAVAAAGSSTAAETVATGDGAAFGIAASPGVAIVSSRAGGLASAPSGWSARIRSVTRRLCWRPSAVSLLAIGLLSAKPTARSRAGATPLAANRRTTELARAPDNSQFDGYTGVLIGRLSVCPSMWMTLSMPASVCATFVLSLIHI